MGADQKLAGGPDLLDIPEVFPGVHKEGVHSGALEGLLVALQVGAQGQGSPLPVDAVNVRERGQQRKVWQKKAACNGDVQPCSHAQESCRGKRTIRPCGQFTALC